MENVFTVHHNPFKKYLFDLNNNAIKSSREQIKDIFNDANDLLNDIEDVICEKEYEFLKETINLKAIPTPKLLVNPLLIFKTPNRQQLSSIL